MIQVLTTLRSPFRMRELYPETRNKRFHFEIENGDLYFRFISLEVSIVWNPRY